jgi:phenylpropionate dioxygenase-like ring-hydroxylating dioxygenase large terminal subunit
MKPISPFIRGLVEDIAASTVDVKQALTMPREAYTSTEYFELEKEAIFMKEWMAVGHQNQIPKPGDTLTVTLVDEPVLLVRDLDGNIRALSAVCRHRGFPLTSGKQHEAGTCQAIVCPYHRWSYDLCGNLVGAPHMRETVDLETLRGESKLPEFKVEIVLGFIFINFDPDAAPLRPTLAKFEEECKNYDIENLVPMPTIVTEHLNYNWKILHENALEPYHTLYVHAGYHEMAPATMAEFMDFDDEDGQIMHPTKFVHQDAGFNPSGKALFPIFPTVGEKERSQVLFGSVPPTLFFACMPDQVFAFFVLPTSATTTTLLITWFFPKQTLEWKQFQWAFDSQAAQNDVLNIQDQEANVMLQQGLNSRFGTRGRYSHMEKTLPQFNRWIYKRLQKYVESVDMVAATQPVRALSPV